MKLNVMIVDDEAPARRKLERLLAAHDDIDIVAQAANGIDAVDLASQTQPEIIFLDIQMPDLDGIGVAAALAQAERAAHIVFVTAYDDYAVRAFEVNAVDYLLKPFDAERFERALERARQRHGNASALARILTQARPQTAYAARVLVPNDGRAFFVPVDTIMRLESEGNNVRLYVSGASHTLRATLDSFEERLDPAHFVRVHRSHIVRIDQLSALERWFRGDLTITLADGTKLPWSRRYAAKRPELLR